MYAIKLITFLPNDTNETPFEKRESLNNLREAGPATLAQPSEITLIC